VSGIGALQARRTDLYTQARTERQHLLLRLQVLEVETFIPMVLQRQEDGVARLKRVILIGTPMYTSDACLVVAQRWSVHACDLQFCPCCRAFFSRFAHVRCITALRSIRVQPNSCQSSHHHALSWLCGC
jgi:hypothetical protein